MKGYSNYEMTKDEYYMTIAKIAGMQYDGQPHNAICIVDQDDRIVSIGSEMPKEQLSPGDSESNMKMYTIRFPDRELAARILQSNIRTVIYDEDGVSDSLLSLKIARNLNSAGITCRKYHKSGKTLAFAL